MILYLVCGMLYNRFVLKLSGFDQVPQFSLTSLKYHASSSFETLTDIVGNFLQQSRGLRIRMTSWMPINSNQDTMNPNSHQWMHGGDGGDFVDRRQRFGLERQTLSGTREERGPIIDPGGEDDPTPTPSSTRGGMDSDGVIRL
jgi:hypothetical protein